MTGSTKNKIGSTFNPADQEQIEPEGGEGEGEYYDEEGSYEEEPQQECHEHKTIDECNMSGCVFNSRYSHCFPEEISRGLGWTKFTSSDETKEYLKKHDIRYGIFKQGKNFTKQQLFVTTKRIMGIFAKVCKRIFDKYVGGKDVSAMERSIKMLIIIAIFAVLYYLRHITLFNPNIQQLMNSEKTSFMVKKMVMLIQMCAGGLFMMPASQIVGEFTGAMQGIVTEWLNELLPMVPKPIMGYVSSALNFILTLFGVFSIDRFVDDGIMKHVATKFASEKSAKNILELVRQKNALGLLKEKMNLIQQAGDEVYFDSSGHLKIKINVSQVKHVNEGSFEWTSLLSPSGWMKMRDDAVKKGVNFMVGNTKEKRLMKGLHASSGNVDLGKFDKIVDFGMITQSDKESLIDLIDNKNSGFLSWGTRNRATKILKPQDKTIYSLAEVNALQKMFIGIDKTISAVAKHKQLWKTLDTAQEIGGEAVTGYGYAQQGVDMVDGKLGQDFQKDFGGVANVIKIFLAVMNPMHFVTGILDDKLPRLINVIYSIIAGIGQLFTGKRSLSSIFSGLKKNPEKAVPKPKTNITEEFDEKERESVRESVRRSVRMRSSKRASKRSIKNRISSRRRSSSKRASKRTRSRRVSSRRTNSRKN
jgi:hypothetical protein